MVRLVTSLVVRVWRRCSGHNRVRLLLMLLLGPSSGCDNVSVLLSYGSSMIVSTTHYLLLLLGEGWREDGLVPIHHYSARIVLTEGLLLVFVQVELVILLLMRRRLLLRVFFDLRSMR